MQKSRFHFYLTTTILFSSALAMTMQWPALAQPTPLGSSKSDKPANKPKDQKLPTTPNGTKPLDPAEYEPFINAMHKLKNDTAISVQEATAVSQAITDTITSIKTNTAAIASDSGQSAGFDGLIANVDTVTKKGLIAQDKLRTPRVTIDKLLRDLTSHGKEFARALAVKKPSSGLVDAIATYASLQSTALDLQAVVGELSASVPKPELGNPTSHGKVSDLVKALLAIPDAEKKFLTKTSKLVDVLNDLPSDAGKSRLRDALVKALPDFGKVLQLRYDSNSKIPKLNGTEYLRGLGENLRNVDPKADIDKALIDTETGQSPLNSRINLTLSKTGPWFARLVSDAQDEIKASRDIFNQTLDQPRQNIDAAHAQAKLESLLTAQLDTIFQSAKDLLTDGAPIAKSDFPKICIPTGFVIQNLQDQLDYLRQARERLSIVVTELGAPHPFDITRWESDQIPLFYFDDVTRLIRVLNPDAKQIGDNSAQAAAKAARDSLDTASQTLANARANVQDLRAALARRMEDLRLVHIAADVGTEQNKKEMQSVRDAAKQAGDRLAKLKLDQEELSAKSTAAQSDQDNAQSDYTAETKDPKASAEDIAAAKAKLDAARQRSIDATERTNIAKARVTQASSQNDAAQAELTRISGDTSKTTTDLNAQTSALQSKLETAQQDEQQATAKVRDAMTTAFLTAQADNAAFAYSRDNAPFFSAVPTSDQFKTDEPSVSSDPVKRVMLFAFPNSRTLFIRGSESDVALVKEMIAQFDQPQAQAEMSVYTMEVGSEATKEGVMRAMEATRQLEEELAIHNVQVDTCLIYLRELINKLIPKYCDTALKPISEYTEFFDDTVLSEIGYDKSKQPDQATVEKHLRSFLPSPSGTATLAEALIVLALARREIRDAVITEFTKGIGCKVEKAVTELPRVTVREKAKQRLRSYERDEHMDPGDESVQSKGTGKDSNGTGSADYKPILFSNLKRLFMSIDSLIGEDSADVRAFQGEIVGELKDNAASSLVIELKQYLDQDSYQERQMKSIEDRYELIRDNVIHKLREIDQFNPRSSEVSAAKDQAEDALQTANVALVTASRNLTMAQVHSKKAGVQPSLKDINDVTALLTNPDKAGGLTQLMRNEKRQVAAITANSAAIFAQIVPESVDTTFFHDAIQSAQKTAEAVDIVEAGADKAQVAAESLKSSPEVVAVLDATKKVADATANRKKAEADAQALYEEIQQKILELIQQCEVENKNVMGDQNGVTGLDDQHKHFAVIRTGILGALAFPATFVLSAQGIDKDSVQAELKQFKDQLCRSTGVGKKLHDELTEVVLKLKVLQNGIRVYDNAAAQFDPKSPRYPKAAVSPKKTNALWPIFLPGMRLNVIRIIEPLSQKLQNALTVPFPYFAKSTVGRLTAQARGELRADWYQKRHAARARTNETLKRFIMAIDADIKRQYVNPLIHRLQTRLMEAKLQVGIVQKTSILASNRLVARVDPQASASLPLDQEQNLLQQSLQLAQLVASASTNGAAASLTGGATGAASAVNILKQLNGMPKDPPAGIYGITTGNVFQITPIFDPTGQALRFKFDYVAANQVREPSGSTNPALPRIERHSINTEVQLSNYQFRAVSSFVSNAKLGRATRYSGGIPILKNIPVINQIPLIGWFTRSGGQAAIVQQSFVLAYTSMYPTIQDVLSALIRPSGSPVADFSAPLQPK